MTASMESRRSFWTSAGSGAALRARGPAAAAFLRGVPGAFAASASAGAGLGGRRLAGGLAGSEVGFLAMRCAPAGRVGGW